MESKSKYTFDDYLNCTLFDVHKWSEYPEVLAVRKQLLNELGFKGSKKEVEHVTVVLLNLYYAYCLDPDTWVMYSRDRNDYKQGTRYNKLFIKYDNMVKTVDGLLALGYIENAKGFIDRGSLKAFDSRMKATNKLIDVIKKKHAVKFEMISKYVPDELIVLRNADGVDIDYGDTKEINQMRSVMESYNQLLEKTYIDIHIDVADILGKIDACRKKIDKKTGLPKEYRLAINLSNKRVKRIFNKSTFNLGGRFYGGWWQNIPSKLREKIIINTDYTVEIDYSGLHIYLLYALKGINFADLDMEPYIYSKDNDPNNYRPIMKTLLLAAINSKTEDECIKAVRYEINMNKDAYPDEIPDLIEIYKKFKEYHSDISDMFCSKSGLMLQRWDSTIAEYIVNKLTEERIPVLVVHDSFICSKKEEAYLYDLMIEAYYYCASKLNMGDRLSSTPIDVKLKDITLKQPEVNREESIITDHLTWGDKPQARRFRRYLLTEDPSTDVVIKIRNESIIEVGVNISEPVFDETEFSLEFN